MIVSSEGERGQFRKNVALAGTLWFAAFAASFAAALLWLAALGAVVRGDFPDVASTILATSCMLTSLGVALTWALARRVFQAPTAVTETSNLLEDVLPVAGEVAATVESTKMSAHPAVEVGAVVSLSWRTFGKDPLTGLFSQAALVAFADDAVPYFRRYKREVSILMVDVDDFQTIAQSFRVDAADTILRHVAEVLDLSVRKTDKVARFEAQRFVVLLREINEADTLALANRIRDAVSDLGVRLADRTVSVTVSIGAAIVSDQDSVSGTLIERAALALGASKSNGGNRVTFRAAPDPTRREMASALSTGAVGLDRGGGSFRRGRAVGEHGGANLHDVA